MKLIIAAVLSAALIWFAHTPAPQLNNVNSVPKVQQVRAEAARKSPTLVSEQEKAQTKPEPVSQPEPVVATPEPVKAQEPAPQTPLTDKEQLMQAAGIPQSDWAATDYIVAHESSWNSAATNASSGAYGLCQALPKEKMASAGDDYISNPVTQLKWCHQYAHSRYNGWGFAASFWSKARWW